jgi:hypothetical protein
MVAQIGSSRKWRALMFRALRREVVKTVSRLGTSLPAFYMRRLGLRIVHQAKY